MYCPVCFSDTLHIRPSGVIEIVFNEKRKKDTGRFLYNLQKDSEEEILSRLEEKIEEFLTWYAGFQNTEPIEAFDALSADFFCDNKCKLDLVSTRVSVLDGLILKKDAFPIIHRLCERYGIECGLPRIRRSA